MYTRWMSRVTMPTMCPRAPWPVRLAGRAGGPDGRTLSPRAPIGATLALLGCLAAGAWVRPAAAQGPPAATPGGAGEAGSSVSGAGPSKAPKSSGQADAVAAMKGDLRRLVSANEVYHVKNKRYASDVSALSGFQASSGVTVVLLGASATGWSGKATSAALPGKSCVIFVGAVSAAPKTEAEGLSAPEAVAVCDRP
jgi:hypothetical protein